MIQWVSAGETWKQQAGTDPKASFLRASFHQAGRCNAQYEKRGNQSYLTVNLASYKKDQSDKTCPMAQPWQEHHWSNYSLSQLGAKHLKMDKIW